jgi:chromate transporter
MAGRPVAEGAPADVPAAPPLGEAVWTWTRIGCLGFGGPAGQIALMHRIFVDEKRWISDARFLHALNFCMLLPGPEAQQLATYVGWLTRGLTGALLAGVLFVAPGAAVMLGLVVAYHLYGETDLLSALFFGVRAGVIVIVFDAVRRIWLRALATRVHEAIAAVAFVALFVFEVPFPLVVLCAGLFGLAFTDLVAGKSGGEGAAAAPAPADRRHLGPGRALRVTVVGLAVWFAPVAAVAFALGPGSVFTDIGVFFAQMAVVTFGGAYAVLAYVAQQAVEVYGWMAPGEMLDGLGLAETTPGPLILVVEFVGYLAAARAGPAEGAGAVGMGVLGAALTLWVTFAPSFLWIILGAPHMERLRGNRALAGALSAITAAVVGVMANLAVWLALHVVFAEVGESHLGPARILVPEAASIDWAAVALSAAAFLAVFRFGAGILTVMGLTAAAGAALRLAL